MQTTLGGCIGEDRKTSVIKRTIDFLQWASKKEDNNITITCESLVPWLRVVLTEKTYLLQEYVEYLDTTLKLAASTVKGNLYDLA